LTYTTVYRNDNKQFVHQLTQLSVSLHIGTENTISSSKLNIIGLCRRLRIATILKFDMQGRTNHLELEPEAIHDLLHLYIFRIHERVFLNQLLHLANNCFGPWRETSWIKPDCRSPNVNTTPIETKLLSNLKTNLQANLSAFFLARDKAVTVAFIVAFLVMGVLQVQRRIKQVIHGLPQHKKMLQNWHGVETKLKIA